MNCLLCGRPLKTPKSMDLGYGPVCYKKVCGNISKGKSTSMAEISGGNLNLPDDIPGQLELSDYLDSNDT